MTFKHSPVTLLVLRLSLSCSTSLPSFHCLRHFPSSVAQECDYEDLLHESMLINLTLGENTTLQCPSSPDRWCIYITTSHQCHTAATMTGIIAVASNNIGCECKNYHNSPNGSVLPVYNDTLVYCVSGPNCNLCDEDTTLLENPYYIIVVDTENTLNCPSINCPSSTPCICPFINCPTITPQSCPSMNCPTITPQSSPSMNCPTITPQSCPSMNCPTITPQSCPSMNCPTITPQSSPSMNRPTITPQSCSTTSCECPTPSLPIPSSCPSPIMELCCSAPSHTPSHTGPTMTTVLSAGVIAMTLTTRL